MNGDDLISMVDAAILLAGSGAAPVTNLSATQVPFSEDAYPTIRLTWTDNSIHETGFQIERSVAGTSAWHRMYTTGPNVCAWVTPMLEESTTYRFRVRAIPGSVYSNITSAATHEGPGLDYDQPGLFPLAPGHPAARARPSDSLPCRPVTPYPALHEGLDIAPDIPNGLYVEYNSDTTVLTVIEPGIPLPDTEDGQDVWPETMTWMDGESATPGTTDPATSPTRPNVPTDPS